MIRHITLNPNTVLNHVNVIDHINALLKSSMIPHPLYHSKRKGDSNKLNLLNKTRT